MSLSVLDEHIARGPGGPASTFNDRQKRRRRGLPAIARAGTSKKARDISIDKVAVDKRWETSRTAIYAALNGTRLASEGTLCAMVIHWDPRGADAIPEWLKIRYDVEEKIITKPVAAELSAQLPAVTASMQGDVAAAPRPPRRRRNVDTAVLVQLAQNLRSAAAESGLSVTQLAVQAQLGRTTVSQALNGRTVPSAPTVAALARATRARNLERLLALQRIAAGKRSSPSGVQLGSPEPS